MRTPLTLLLWGVAFYSLYCLTRIAIDRSKRSNGFTFNALSPAGLSQVGLRYRKRYMICITIAVFLAALWFIFVDPPTWSI